MGPTAQSMTTRAERRTAAAQRVAPTLRNVSSRDVKLLDTLDRVRTAQGRIGPRGWVRVRQVGGESHSWHANALVKMHKHGLVDREPRANGMWYRITNTGRRLLSAIRKVDDRF
jgi:CTP-dependent riboflavin kinase